MDAQQLDLHPLLTVTMGIGAVTDEAVKLFVIAHPVLKVMIRDERFHADLRRELVTLLDTLMVEADEPSQP